MRDSHPVNSSTRRPPTPDTHSVTTADESAASPQASDRSSGHVGGAICGDTANTSEVVNGFARPAAARESDRSKHGNGNKSARGDTACIGSTGDCSTAFRVSAGESRAGSNGNGRSAADRKTRSEDRANGNGQWPPSGGRSFAPDRWAARRLLSAVQEAAVIQLWDGSEIGDRRAAEVLVRVADRKTLWRILRTGSLGFGDAYSAGTVTVEPLGDGPITTCVPSERARNSLFSPTTCALLRLCERASLTQLQSQSARARVARRIQNSLDRSRDNVYHHYDIGNAFYRLWLDEQKLYTCAYYSDWDTNTLEEAQTAKMDLVCRKLRLQPGQEVVEAGCGWGALALHMAREYGVYVRAYNLSREQLAYARARAEQENLDDRVQFVEADWREIDGTCDAFVSVGMLEHVGPENYETLAAVIRRVLRPDGLALLHSIGRNAAAPLDSWTARRIFPGAHPPSLREAMDIFESGNFSVLDVENLRLHYARTLEDWLHRFEQHEETVREMFDEQFVRMWRLYLAGSIAAFRTGALQLFQWVFARSDNHHVPLTREDVYRK